MPLHRHRHIAATFCAIALLAACTTPADRETRTAKDPVVDLSPVQALTPQAKGARVHWSGGISAIDTREGGRQCLTMLHATFDAQGVLQWPGDAQDFIACGAGPYDSDLVAQFTLVSFDGRVTGQQVLAGKPVPVIEIEALYRHSDCTQGNENIPQCYSGYLHPRKP